MLYNLESSGIVLVLGAGFTRAFVPGSPLLTDHYDTELLLKRYADFHHARLVLEQEIHQSGDGKINLERLMTRLDMLMPYDYELNADGELKLLLRDLKDAFATKLTVAKQGFRPDEAVLADLAQVCVDRRINCITFNYDDVFDRYLANANSSENYWHPDGGYGFYCRPSYVTVGDGLVSSMDQCSMYLLKLHGSVNWRVMRGSPQPFGVNDVRHHEEWPEASKGPPENYFDIKNHLEKEPFIVPPVLSKSALSDEPVLRLIWHLAHDELGSAKRVFFVGYSFPQTDIAARFLFTEGIHAPTANIQVVNYATSEEEAAALVKSYSDVFPSIPADHFNYRGAVDWARDFVAEMAT